MLFTTPSSIVTNQILQLRGSTGCVLDQTGSVQYISTQKCVYVIVSCLTVNKQRAKKIPLYTQTDNIKYEPQCMQYTHNISTSCDYWK